MASVRYGVYGDRGTPFTLFMPGHGLQPAVSMLSTSLYSFCSNGEASGNIVYVSSSPSILAISFWEARLGTFSIAVIDT